jgi:hypothetical protein
LNGHADATQAIQQIKAGKSRAHDNDIQLLFFA